MKDTTWIVEARREQFSYCRTIGQVTYQWGIFLCLLAMDLRASTQGVHKHDEGGIEQGLHGWTSNPIIPKLLALSK